MLWPPCCPSLQRFKSCRLSEPLAQLLHMLHRLVLFLRPCLGTGPGPDLESGLGPLLRPHLGAGLQTGLRPHLLS